MRRGRCGARSSPSLDRWGATSEQSCRSGGSSRMGERCDSVSPHAPHDGRTSRPAASCRTSSAAARAVWVLWNAEARRGACEQRPWLPRSRSLPNESAFLAAKSFLRRYRTHREVEVKRTDAPSRRSRLSSMNVDCTSALVTMAAAPEPPAALLAEREDSAPPVPKSRTSSLLPIVVSGVGFFSDVRSSPPGSR